MQDEYSSLLQLILNLKKEQKNELDATQIYNTWSIKNQNRCFTSFIDTMSLIQKMITWPISLLMELEQENK